MKQDPHVFISYARKDGEGFAHDLKQRLEDEALGDQRICVWRDREGMRGGDNWWVQIEEVLHQVQYMVVVMTPGVIPSKIVHREWNMARANGVCVFPVEVSVKMDWDRLPLWMRYAHRYDLKNHWQTFVNHLNERCRQLRVPFMVRRLPVNLVKRTRLYDELIANLVEDEKSRPTAITAALRGAGGFGKTTMAQLLCHDPRIKNTFFDGILWVTLGENPDNLTSEVQKLIDELSNHWPDHQSFTDVRSASNHLGLLLKERHTLLVIDDVWDERDAKPFLVGGVGCSWLMTTRNRDTLPPEAVEVNVDEMEIDEAVETLGWGMPIEEERIAFENLAGRLGEWPLLLNFVNRVLHDRYRRGMSLREALTAVTDKLERKGLTAFDRRNAEERNEAVEKTIGVSLELLTREEIDRFEELAVFPEDTSIPIETIAKLWAETATMDAAQTKDLCDKLFDLSLLQVYDLTQQYVRLHDVVRAYLRDRAGKDKVRELDAILVDAHHYEDPAAMPANEPYLWRTLTMHMIGAERHEAYVNLVSRFAWMKAKLSSTDVVALLEDFRHIPSLNLSKQKNRLMKLLMSALRLSAPILASDPGQLSIQIWGRLLSNNDDAVRNFKSELQDHRPAVWLEPLSASLRPAGGHLIQVLHGKPDIVSRVSVNDGQGDDSQQAIVAFDSGRLVFWDLNTGESAEVHESMKNVTWRCASHPTLPLFILACRGKLKIFNAVKRVFIREEDSGSKKVVDLAVSNDGKRLCSIQENPISACMWSLPDLRLLN